MMNNYIAVCDPVGQWVEYVFFDGRSKDAAMRASIEAKSLRRGRSKHVTCAVWRRVAGVDGAIPEIGEVTEMT